MNVRPRPCVNSKIRPIHKSTNTQPKTRQKSKSQQSEVRGHTQTITQDERKASLHVGKTRQNHARQATSGTTHSARTTACVVLIGTCVCNCVCCTCFVGEALRPCRNRAAFLLSSLIPNLVSMALFVQPPLDSRWCCRLCEHRGPLVAPSAQISPGRCCCVRAPWLPTSRCCFEVLVGSFVCAEVNIPMCPFTLFQHRRSHTLCSFQDGALSFRLPLSSR